MSGGWAKKGSFALLDQGLFSLANFALHILLARWLEPAAYGAFAVAFSGLMLALAVHNSLVSDPMMVFGAGKYAGEFGNYLRLLVRGHWVVAAGLGAAAAAAAVALRAAGAVEVSRVVAGLAVTTPAFLLLWLLRRARCAQMRYRAAAAGSAAFLLVVLGGIWGLGQVGSLSPLTAMLALGVAGAVGSGVLWERKPSQKAKVEEKEVAADHWNYARWDLPAVGLFFASGEFLSVLAPVLLGLEAVAAMSATANLFKPLHPFLQSLGNLFVPALSKAAQEETSRVRRITRWFLLLGPGVVALYGLGMAAWGPQVMRSLYQGRYPDGSLLYLFGLFYTGSAVTTVFTTALKTTGNVRAVFRIWTAPAVLVALAAAPAMLAGGLTGALWVLVASYWLAALLAWRQYGAMRRRGDGETERRWVQKKLAGVVGRWNGGNRARRVVVLCYHSVHPSKSFRSATPELFRRHLRWLQENCEVIGFEEALETARAGRQGRPAVAITFDDGYADNYEYAFPLLGAHGMKATFFLTAGLLEGDREVRERLAALQGAGWDEVQPLEWSQVREMREAGMTFGAHTWSHPNLAGLGREAAYGELLRSREVVERRLLEKVRLAAYPFGIPRRHVTGQTLEAARAAGFQGAATVLYRAVRAGDGELGIPRFSVTGDSVEELRQKVEGDWDYLGWWQESGPGWATRWISKGNGT